LQLLFDARFLFISLSLLLLSLVNLKTVFFTFKFSNNNSVNFLFCEEILIILTNHSKKTKIILTIGNPSAIIKNNFL